MIFKFGPYLETPVSARWIRLSDMERASINSGSRDGELLLNFTASARFFFARSRKCVLVSASAILASSFLTLSSNCAVTRLFVSALAASAPFAAAITGEYGKAERHALPAQQPSVRP